jgi:hypothetical protein
MALAGAEEMKKNDRLKRDAKENMINLKTLNHCCGLVRTVPEHHYEA